MLVVDFLLLTAQTYFLKIPGHKRLGRSSADTVSRQSLLHNWMLAHQAGRMFHHSFRQATNYTYVHVYLSPLRLHGASFEYI